MNISHTFLRSRVKKIFFALLLVSIFSVPVKTLAQNIAAFGAITSTSNSITVNGVIPGSDQEPIVFEYSKTNDINTVTAANIVEGVTSQGDFTITLSPLDPNTTYYIWVTGSSFSTISTSMATQAANSSSTGSGGTITINAVTATSSADGTSETINGTASNYGSTTAVTVSCTDAAQSILASPTATIGSGGAFSAVCPYLNPGSNYFYSVLDSSLSVLYGPIAFTTSGTSAGGGGASGTGSNFSTGTTTYKSGVVSPISIGQITQNKANFSGTVTSGKTNSSVLIEFGKLSAGKFEHNYSPTVGSNGVFSTPIISLDPSTVYEVMAVDATNQTIALSKLVSFRTLDISVSPNVQSIGPTTATITANVAGGGTQTLSVQYGPNSSPGTITGTTTTSTSTTTTGGTSNSTTASATAVVFGSSVNVNGSVGSTGASAVSIYYGSNPTAQTAPTAFTIHVPAAVASDGTFSATLGNSIIPATYYYAVFYSVSGNPTLVALPGVGVQTFTVTPGPGLVASGYPSSAGVPGPTLSGNAPMVFANGVYTANLTNLSPDTNYTYKIVGTDSSGQSVSYTGLYGFLTQQNPTTNTSPGTIVNTITTGGGTPPSVGSLVSCGRTGQPACTFADVIKFIQNLINFLIFVLAPVIFALVLLWAGVLMLTSGGSTEKFTKARGMIFKAVIGLLIALAAWLIVQAILVGMGYSVYNPATNTGFPKFY